mgnify:CR=1 FL=1|tara:strand:- start:158 stop:754 length:597 start_codon:yes stop_codon:yes gene_type:complete
MKSLFPCNVHEIKIKDFKIIGDEVLKYIYQERKKIPGVIKSNRGGWQSPAIYADFDNILLSTVQKEVGDYFSINRIFREGVKIDFLNMWININKKTNYNETHIHPASHLAGVWWIKVPKDSGKLFFNSPHWFEQYHEMICYSDEFKEAVCTYPDYYIDSCEGGIVLFPSHLYHRVSESNSNQDRISVSFNINIWPPDR